MENCSHLIRDTQDFIAKVRSAYVTARSKFHRFDVGDFFLAGTHDWIVENCSSLIADLNEKKVFKRHFGMQADGDLWEVVWEALKTGDLGVRRCAR